MITLIFEFFGLRSHFQFLRGKIIRYFWSTINVYSLFSHKWWIPLTHHSYKRREYAFIVFRKYTIISLWREVIHNFFFFLIKSFKFDKLIYIVICCLIEIIIQDPWRQCLEVRVYEGPPTSNFQHRRLYIFHRIN